MPFKTVVAIIQGMDDVERVVDCALSFGKRFRSHLIGVHAEVLPVAYTSAIGFPDTDFLQAAAEMNRERAEKIKAAFRQRMEDAGQSFDWRNIENATSDSVHSGIASARCADLVIAAQRNPDVDATETADLDALLYESGRPVLVVPHHGPSYSGYRRIVVAWNGSRQSARAAFDALPLIQEAEHTEVFVIDPPEDSEFDPGASGTEIAAALARHGANVAVASEASNGRSADQVLQARIAATGSDLLVLGAYSHSWLRQLLFGGLTRSVLQSMPIATFMSR